MAGISKADQTYKKEKQKPKTKRFRQCRYCKEKTVPYGSLQPFCFNNDCIKKHNQKIKEKEKRVSRQQERKALKDNAEKACNKYIRLRDRKLPCISCGYVWVSSDLSVKVGRERHAGHWKSVAQRGDLRFNEDNIHVQCDYCNTHKGGGLIPEYRVNLIKKIGLEKVEILESNNVPRKYSDDDLIEIARHYNKKSKEIGG